MKLKMVATLFGLAVGAVLPLPRQETAMDSHTNPQKAELSTVSAPPNCAGTATDSARRASTEAFLAEAVAAGARAEFEEHWGRPPEPPPGWSGEDEAVAFDAIALQTGAETFAVDCEYYPCIVMLFGDAGVDADAETFFGVHIDDQVRSSARGNQDWSSTSFAVHDADLSAPLAQRWIRARIARQALLEDRLLRDLDASISADEEVP